MGRYLPLSMIMLAGCATAGKESEAVDASRVDTAPVVDGVVPVTLTQTLDLTVATGQTLACAGGSGTAAYTRENSWYRVFRLADYQITGPLHVTSVQFGIQEASANQSIELKLGVYFGPVGAATLDLAMVSPLVSRTLNLATAVTNELVDTPIDTRVPAGSNLIVEVHAPDHLNMARYFYAGATAGGETAPGYLRTPHCPAANPILVPRAMKDIDATAGSLIIAVKGTY